MSNTAMPAFAGVALPTSSTVLERLDPRYYGESTGQWYGRYLGMDCEGAAVVIQNVRRLLPAIRSQHLPAGDLLTNFPLCGEFGVGIRGCNSLVPTFNSLFFTRLG